MSPEEGIGILERIGRELAELLGTEEFEGVYVGPWWEVPVLAAAPHDPPEKGWKCAVLRRRPEGGAEHWGHFFLVAGNEAGSARMVASKLRGLSERRFGEPVPFPAGPPPAPFTILARPSGGGPDPPILHLARRLAGRLASADGSSRAD